MYNQKVFQPEDLSTEEWSILQHIADLPEYFYMADASLGFTETSSSVQVSKAMVFSKHFERLKTAGYLVIIPLAFADVKQSTRPLYSLSLLGRRAICQ